MMDPLDKIERIVREQREDIADHLLSGNAADYAGYARAIGAVQALDMVLGEITDLRNKLIEE